MTGEGCSLRCVMGNVGRGKEKDHGMVRHREAQDGSTPEIRLCGWAWGGSIIHLGQPRAYQSERYRPQGYRWTFERGKRTMERR